MFIEICALNIQSALAAQQGGARRIELCSALDTGGLTPSPGLIRQVRQALAIPVHVLLRPREGNFCYTERELAVLIDDVHFCREAGVNGIVIGALDDNGSVDVSKIQRLMDAAASLEITFHRAFDFTADPFAALETLIDLGISRVLSSGQAPSAWEGRFLLQKLVEKAAGRITVMPGAGITTDNIRALAEISGAAEFHLTAKKKIVQGHNDIPGLENWYWETDEAMVRELAG